MTIRQDLVRCIEAGGDTDAVARRIIGMLSLECSMDNGNGWYDDDPDLADGDGMEKAERSWRAARSPKALAAQRIERLADLARRIRIFALLALLGLAACGVTPPPLPSGPWYSFEQGKPQ